MNGEKVQCLILGCGNTLRCDDGIGPYLCAWAEERFAAERGVRVIARQQWTPELAEDIANAGSVVFVDCSIAQQPGAILWREIAAEAPAEPGSHHLGAAELLALASELFLSRPQRACLLTIGAGSLEVGESFSPAVAASVNAAQRTLERAVRQALDSAPDSAQRRYEA